MNGLIYIAAVPKCVRSINFETTPPTAIVCAWCSTKETGDFWATRKGMRVSHGICPQCAKKQVLHDITQ
jgi:hypothetical protein